MPHPFSAIFISFFITLTNCSYSGQSAPPESSHRADSPAIEDTGISEEQIALQKASVHVDMGAASNKIMEHLGAIKTHADLLKYTDGNEEVKKLDFNTFLLTDFFITKNHAVFILTCVLHNDSIRYARTSSVDFKRLADKEFISDNRFIDDYLLKHNELYKTHKKRQDFIDELIRQNEPIKLCAGDGACVYGERETLFFKSLKQSDYNHSLTLLTSMNPESQALGIIGVEKLKREGVAVDEYTGKMIEHLKARNTSLSYHITCVSGRRKLSSFLAGYNSDKSLDADMKTCDKQ